MECTHGRAAPSGRGALLHGDCFQALLRAGKGGSHTGRPLTTDQYIHIDGLFDLAVRDGVCHKSDLALTGSCGTAQVFLTGRETALHFCSSRSFGRRFDGHTHCLLDAGSSCLPHGTRSVGRTGNAVDLCALGLHQSLLEILSRVAGQVDGLVGGVHRHVGNSILGKGHADRHLTHTGSLGGISARRINSSARSGSRRGTCRIPAGSQCTRSHTAHSSRGGQLQKTGTRDFFHCIVLPFSSQQLIRSCVVCTKALYYV